MFPSLAESSLSSLESRSPKSNGRPSAVKATDRSSSWSCPVCTFLNENDDFLACEICGNKKPAKAAPLMPDPDKQRDGSHSLVIDDKIQQVKQIQQEISEDFEKVETEMSPKKHRASLKKLGEADGWIKELDKMLKTGGDSHSTPPMLAHASSNNSRTRGKPVSKRRPRKEARHSPTMDSRAVEMDHIMDFQLQLWNRLRPNSN